MKISEIRAANKNHQAINFKLKQKFTVFLWDSNYLDHLDKTGATKAEPSFIFGQTNKKHPHPTGYYIASVMSSILYRTNDLNPYSAKKATELTFLFNDNLAQVYDDLYVKAQKIKQRLAHEESLFDDTDNSFSEAFDNKELQSFNLAVPPRIVTKNSVLLIRALKLLDNTVCDLEKLCQMRVVPPPIFLKERRLLASPIRRYFLDVSAQAKQFHSERKKPIQPKGRHIITEKREVLDRHWSIEWIKGLFPRPPFYAKN